MTSYTVCKLLMLMHENVKTRTNRIAPYTTHTFWKTPVKSAPTPKNTNFPDTFMLEQVKSLGSPSLYLKLTKSTPSVVDSQYREYPSWSARYCRFISPQSISYEFRKNIHVNIDLYYKAQFKRRISLAPNLKQLSKNNRCFCICIKFGTYEMRHVWTRPI